MALNVFTIALITLGTFILTVIGFLLWLTWEMVEEAYKKGED